MRACLLHEWADSISCAFMKCTPYKRDFFVQGDVWGSKIWHTADLNWAWSQHTEINWDKTKNAPDIL